MFPKLRLGDARMSSFFPQYTSPPSRPVDEHHLAELSPRPEDALLASGMDSSDHIPSRAKASVRIQEPPWSHDSAVNKAYKKQEETHEELDIWRPSFHSEPQDPYSGHAGPRRSIFESVFMARPSFSERTPSTKVDQSFKVLERRERQMQMELQQLLDAQDYALEKHLANTSPDDNTSRRSSTPEPDKNQGYVVPVRQPKKRHLSKMEARNGIARCISQLSDLKNEEEAYIATALAERKSALARLRNLSTKRNTIVAEMKTIESDRGQSHKNSIRKMEQQHGALCENIVKLEEQLRDLRRTKARLETRMAEAKSARDSELSGYKGALNECDERIKDILTYPEVSVLEVEGLLAQDADLQALAGKHISGFEFLSLRSERRTLPMAKDWWEGEVQVLEARKAAVDKERAALDEGTELWQGMVARLEEHDRHLKRTFDAMARYSSSKQQDSDFIPLGEILKKQYAMCKETTKELEELHDYTESQGWNLLITALGAEIHYFHGLRKQLGDTLGFVGLADGVVTPRPSTPSGAPNNNNNSNNSRQDLLGADDSSSGSGAGLTRIQSEDDEISGSVIRRWDGTEEETRRDVYSGYGGDNDDHHHHHDLLGREDSDNNEVPPGLLISEVHHESGGEDDEHNEVPLEFLSMHSPALKFGNRGKGKMVEPEHEQKPEEGRRPALSRESTSSVNEVPTYLMSESHRSSS